MQITPNIATSNAGASITVSMSEQEACNLFGAIQALPEVVRTAFSNLLSVEDLQTACSAISTPAVEPAPVVEPAVAAPTE